MRKTGLLDVARRIVERRPTQIDPAEHRSAAGGAIVGGRRIDLRPDPADGQQPGDEPVGVSAEGEPGSHWAEDSDSTRA
jgi:hypothetical protein